MALAAIAAGADGLIVEVHPDPARALSDGPQSLTPTRFFELVQGVRAIAEATGRRLRKPGGEREEEKWHAELSASPWRPAAVVSQGS
jgi:3-deoxy-7-phosphoheptulonate synthase